MHTRGGEKLEIYLDLVCLLNFLVDLFLLLGTNRLAGFPNQLWRVIIAAALGGVYSGLCLLRELRFLGNGLWRIVVLVLMALIAFGWDKSAVRRGGLFVLLSLALGGAAVGIGRASILTLLLTAAGLWLLCTAAFPKGIGGREYVPVRIRYQERVLSLNALMDTGNTLRDPVTGEQVMVIGPLAAMRLTGLTKAQLSVPLDTIQKQPVQGLRLIPYSSVGNSGGMMLALRFQDVTIGNKRRSCIVAMAPGGLGDYEALTGGV